MKNLKEITLDQLSMVQGGGEPVPGAEVYVEQEPGDKPVVNTEDTTNDNLLAASGSYNSSRSNVAS
jgi:hypothetical protein